MTARPLTVDRVGQSVFDGPSDFVYVPRDAAVVITSPAGGRFALPSAVCESRAGVSRHQPADRGACGESAGPALRAAR